MIVLVKSNTDFRIVADTVDRSIGSTIDRVVTLLQIKWSELGPGPGLENFCLEPVPVEPRPPKYEPPIPMPGRLAFSFAGLHSWVERTVFASGGLPNVNRHALARAFQNAAFEQLETKLVLALQWCQTHGHFVQHVVVSGGVASNAYLRQRCAPRPLLQCH
jgi:N6-L-threonylcarbamoyladenine synthase